MISSSFIPQYSVIPPSPLTLMIGLAASRGNLKQDVLQMATKSPMPPTTSRVQQTLGGKTISTCVPQVHPQHGMSFALHSVSITSRRVLWTVNVRNFAPSPKAEGLLTSIAVSSTGWLVMQLKRSPLTLRSKRGSEEDSILSSAMIL